MIIQYSNRNTWTTQLEKDRNNESNENTTNNNYVVLNVTHLAVIPLKAMQFITHVHYIVTLYLNKRWYNFSLSSAFRYKNTMF